MLKPLHVQLQLFIHSNETSNYGSTTSKQIVVSSMFLLTNLTKKQGEANFQTKQQDNKTGDSKRCGGSR